MRAVPVLALAILLASSPAFAGKDVKADLAAGKARQAELAKQAGALNSEVGTLRSKLVKMSASLRETEEKISETDTRLKDLRDKKATFSESLYKNQDAIGGLVTAARRYRQSSTPTLLLRGQPVDAARAALVIKSMIPELDRQSESLKAELAVLEGIEKDIVRAQSIQSEELSKLNKKKGDLSKLVEERKTLYKQTEAERSEQERAVRKLAEKAKNLDDLVSKIEPRKKTASTYRLPGNVPLPVNGTVHTGFGEKDDLGGKSRGITFSTRSAATVVTPLAGKVKFAGPFQKYRQILIIEHRGGYHSLIAGLGRIDTVVGAQLAAGEPVGSAESTSSAQVYYELRQNGAPVNPQKLLVAQRKQDNRS
jgi:septal ring factor EnvC (AmiA/AmiB activator)